MGIDLKVYVNFMIFEIIIRIHRVIKIFPLQNRKM